MSENSKQYCIDCNKAFSNKGNLNKHRKIKHGYIPDQADDNPNEKPKVECDKSNKKFKENFTSFLD